MDSRQQPMDCNCHIVTQIQFLPVLFEFNASKLSKISSSDKSLGQPYAAKTASSSFLCASSSQAGRALYKSVSLRFFFSTRRPDPPAPLVPRFLRGALCGVPGLDFHQRAKPALSRCPELCRSGSRRDDFQDTPRFVSQPFYPFLVLCSFFD
jgi:hypothetical protein